MAYFQRLVQNEDKTPQWYLARFMDVINIINDADSIATAGFFIKGLLPSSMMFEDLIKHSPYDMAKVRTKAEDMFRVLECSEK